MIKCSIDAVARRMPIIWVHAVVQSRCDLQRSRSRRASADQVSLIIHQRGTMLFTRAIKACLTTVVATAIFSANTFALESEPDDDATCYCQWTCIRSLAPTGPNNPMSESGTTSSVVQSVPQHSSGPDCSSLMPLECPSGNGWSIASNWSCGGNCECTWDCTGPSGTTPSSVSGSKSCGEMATYAGCGTGETMSNLSCRYIDWF